VQASRSDAQQLSNLSGRTVGLLEADMRKTIPRSRRFQGHGLAVLAEISPLALTMTLMLQATTAFAQDALQEAAQGAHQAGIIELPAVEVTVDSQTPQATEGATVSAGDWNAGRYE
jgi:hypothetical protein